jgi:membrane protein required for beta-lactamase induction
VLGVEAVGTDQQAYQRTVLESIFVKVNDDLYGVMFWFVLLGPFGAMLYRLTGLLQHADHAQSESYMAAARRLNYILHYPVVYVSVLAYALAGNMLEASAAWKPLKYVPLARAEEVLRSVAVAALHYLPADDRGRSYWLLATQALINRGLIIWLVVLGVLTIMGVVR